MKNYLQKEFLCFPYSTEASFLCLVGEFNRSKSPYQNETKLFCLEKFPVGNIFLAFHIDFPFPFFPAFSTRSLLHRQQKFLLPSNLRWRPHTYTFHLFLWIPPQKCNRKMNEKNVKIFLQSFFFHSPHKNFLLLLAQRRSRKSKAGRLSSAEKRIAIFQVREEKLEMKKRTFPCHAKYCVTSE